MNTDEMTSKLLQGLGKSTRRGIKRCSKCGIYNGTRGIFCKNKNCGVSLRSSENPTYEFDAVKLITGTSRQVYSVRVKDMASECRGFVQLPLLQSSMEDNNNILSDAALCFVDSCQSSFDNSILKCHEEIQNNADVEICDHISLALKSQVVAKPIFFDDYMLNDLNIPNEVKQSLYLLASDNACPLVQQVSKNIMAVRCQVTPKQPLGYLHFNINKGRSKAYDKYYCNCTEYLYPAQKIPKNCTKQKCIHYYACVAALSSNPSYCEEYSYFLNDEATTKNLYCTKNKIHNSPYNKIIKQIDLHNVKSRKINIISNTIIKKPVITKKVKKKSCKNEKLIIQRCKKIVPKVFPIEIKVLDELPTTENKEPEVSWGFLDWLAFVTESINRTMQFINCGIVNMQIFYIPEDFWLALKKRIPTSYIENKTDIGSIFYNIMNINHVKEIFDTPKEKKKSCKNQKLIIQRCKKIVPKVFPIEIKVLDELPTTENKEPEVSWGFLDWLAFVTESINRTMQFINCGIVNMQIFYIPEDFWLTLKKRIPTSYIENKTDIGSIFYNIMNINHVKEIFDTPKVKVRIAKKLVPDKQNGYVEYDESKADEEANVEYCFSFLFFLNVGPSTVDESDDQNNAFVIEWLPNICASTQVGQLKLQYKYGRKSI
ncbi:uncharacterized protein C2orf42 homolog [Sitophilus oryzae]|uniref:Uncharacterized protein C2orf42 homolog n=1 Tax=Sitophilus oryzae TaxID=7048 RepID=A0A6J2Y1M9_SITOR|nr:uncharacterized protein C2orf42 homolog [Sitophilus oryzae]